MLDPFDLMAMGDDDAGSSPFGGFAMARMAIVASGYLGTALTASTLVPIVLYVVARWRDAREPTADPQLGLKFALGVLRVVTLQLGLLGASLLCYALTLKQGTSDVARVAFGLLIPATLFYVIALWGCSKSNHDQRPMVGRMLDGWSLVQCAIASMLGTVLMFQGLMQKHGTELLKFGVSLALPYSIAFAVLVAARLRQAAFDAAMAAITPPPPLVSAPPPPVSPPPPPPPETYAPRE